VIQYSGAFVFIVSALEYWVARSSRAMTTEYGDAVTPTKGAALPQAKWLASNYPTG
jgi:hypothetical protein